MIVKFDNVLIGLASFQRRMWYVGRKGANAESILPDMRGEVYDEHLRLLDRELRREIYAKARRIDRVGTLYHRMIIFSPKDPDMPPNILKEIVRGTMDDYMMESLKKDTRYFFGIHKHGRRGKLVPPLRIHAHVVVWAPTVEGVSASLEMMRRLRYVGNDLESAFSGGVML